MTHPTNFYYLLGKMNVNILEGQQIIGILFLILKDSIPAGLRKISP